MSNPLRRLYRSAVLPVAAGTVLALATGVAPAGAVTAQSRTIQGSATNHEEKEWFNKAFDTGERFFGKLRGRIRFITDTTATLSTTRVVSTTDRGTIDAGSNITTTINNSAAASRLAVTSRPALQLIWEYQPQGDSYVCDNVNFPTFPDDQWFMRTDGGGAIADGACGAIEVTADDLNWILQQFGIDLELPEVFILIDTFFTAGFSGTQNLQQSHQLLEIKVCKILTDTFGLPIGDHCDVELNAVVTAPLTTLGHTLEAQVCMDGTLPNGTQLDCLVNIGEKQSITFTGTGKTFSVKAPCPSGIKEIDVRLTDPAWNARLDDVTIGLTADFNVHLTANGDGVDVITLPLPGSISLLTAPLPLNVTYAAAAQNFVLHIGEVTPDDDAPLVFLNPTAVTIDEGSSHTFAPFMADSCDSGLTGSWTIDGAKLTGTTLTRAYGNDRPNPLHTGSLLVTDDAGNAAPSVPISVTVRNVAPSVQMGGFPANPVPVGSSVAIQTQVADPGSDVMNWQWSWGDGSTEGRTATSVSDRGDNRSHVYTAEGEHTLQVGVHDGTDLRSVGGKVVVFDARDRLVGSGTFTSDSSSVNVPVGSSYSAQATVAYAQGAVRPSGSFVSDFLISIGGNETVSKHLVATSYEWIFETGLVSRTQGFATLNGEPGWKFMAEVTRSKVGAQTSRITVSVWRPGITTLANPDYRFGGPRATGNIQ